MTRRNSIHRERAIKNMGREVEVVNYEHDGSTDEYGDPDPSGFTETRHTTYALVEESQRPEQREGGDGATMNTEFRIFLPQDVPVYMAGENYKQYDYQRMRGSRIIDSYMDKEWKVFDVWQKTFGVTQTLCRTQ